VVTDLKLHAELLHNLDFKVLSTGQTVRSTSTFSLRTIEGAIVQKIVKLGELGTKESLELFVPPVPLSKSPSRKSTGKSTSRLSSYPSQIISVKPS